jgi:hypothetical protein
VSVRYSDIGGYTRWESPHSRNLRKIPVGASPDFFSIVWARIHEFFGNKFVSATMYPATSINSELPLQIRFIGTTGHHPYKLGICNNPCVRAANKTAPNKGSPAAPKILAWHSVAWFFTGGCERR